MEDHSSATAPEPLDPDKAREALDSAIDEPSSLPRGAQVAGPEIIVPIVEGIIETLEGGAAGETAVGGAGAAEGTAGAAEGATATEAISTSEISNIIDKANQTIGNDGILVSNQSTAQQAAEQFVGDNARPIYDRVGNNVGEISADGTKVVRYTSVNDPDDPYINLENKSTGGNLHVRWSK